ncbi:MULTISPECIES: MXAN_6640 family putative metalloprotease [unclassified Nocardioides]|uniref:MXAN_6640 family putative metalloprotease n=1 Tax=unclassified Nocardioides TaxID=2615069 RepID=UPI0007003B26|nr:MULTISPECIES: MXAN_6640 family putative metalloprotease [unclassified Nocardioides]KRA31217.1 hypothetical protein ASD81_17285 [Nocardioides sp. Root614]KRA87838.1 hypothetical protein ASD84_17555 [Nocardioides sp. Root682]
MTRRSNFPFSGLLIALLATLLLVPFLGSAAQAEPTDPATPADPGAAAPETPRDVAEQALETVEEILDPAASVTSDADDRAHGKDLTLALRDLAASKADLPKNKRDDAARLLARPTDGVNTAGSYECEGNDGPPCYTQSQAGQKCLTTICVHYARSTDPNRPDGENDGTGGRWAGTDPALPDYVEFVANTFQQVANRYVSAGYTAPLGDVIAGGDAKTDIYIAELGDFGIYGYCATDQDIAGHVAAPAYCVVDNNYKTTEYPAHTPAANLQVTAAHEFFHAVQFAYDVNEDGWFMEGTATWVEDEIFDAINDNRSYLPHGPLGVPHQSLDKWSTLSQYGSWIFFRFLTERYPTASGGLPVVIRKIWERAGNGQYSVQAINNTLGELGTNMGVLFPRFVLWNRMPAQYYAEGSAYRPAPLRASYGLSAAAPGKTVGFTLDHLSAKHLRFVPKMTGAWKLRMRLNLNSSAAGGSAMVTYKPKGKAPVVKAVKLYSDGNGLVVLPFGGRVDWVEVAAVSGSIRYAGCGSPARDYTATCQGYPLDNGVNQGIVVRAVRG